MVKVDWSERRSFIRAKRILSIEYQLIKSARRKIDPAWHLSTTQDMSLGGLTFFTDVEFRPGDILEVRVRFASAEALFPKPKSHRDSAFCAMENRGDASGSKKEPFL